MMSYLEVIGIIDDLRRYVYPPPRGHAMKPDIFLYRSHCHWALTNLRQYLYLHRRSPKTMEDLIEDFRYEMDEFACKTKTPEANFMFSVAYDVATDVLDQIYNIGKVFSEV